MHRYNNRRILSLLMSVIMVLSVIPAVTVMAEESNIVMDEVPERMLDNYPVRALRYIGYDVDRLIEDGNMYQPGYYGQDLDEEYLSNVYYSGVSYGTDTILDDSTATGLAPNIQRYERKGLDCTAFAAYYYFNYLPNIEEIEAGTELLDKCFRHDTHGRYSAAGKAPRTVGGWYDAAKYSVRLGYGKEVGDSFDDLRKAKCGDLLIFKYTELFNQKKCHVAIYIGEYNGKHFMAHTSSRGPEIDAVDTNSNIKEICGIFRFNGMQEPVEDMTVEQPVSVLKHAYCVTSRILPILGNENITLMTKGSATGHAKITS